MKNIPLYLIIAVLISPAAKAQAEHKTSFGIYGQSLKAKTEKPDIFGRTKTTYKSNSYKTLGTSVTEKADIFGRKKTTYKDSSYKKLGTTVTKKPDIFRRLNWFIKAVVNNERVIDFQERFNLAFFTQIAQDFPLKSVSLSLPAIKVIAD